MKKFSLTYRFFCLLLIVFSSTSCFWMNGKKKWKPVQPARHAFVHTVAWPDESLPLIARWYTGNAANAEYLAKANPTVDPERLAVGTFIYIPIKLLKTRDPMTRDFVKRASNPKKAANKPKQAPVPKKGSPGKNDESTEEFELFGPR